MLIKTLMLCAAALTASAAPTTCDTKASSAATACEIFEKRFPNQTFYPGTSDYDFETKTQIWAVQSRLDPACVFVPQSAHQVSFAVITFTLTKTKFAVRGGGHMPLRGFNSIGASGVLLSMTKLKTIALSEDKTVASIGPGNRWLNVYEYLEPHGLVAVGGRVGQVGVPGLLLGGGISFYSNQYGFASDNVVKYECILADGRIAEVTPQNSYSDLFWALKGGGNSFCIVTRFDIQTYPSSKVWVGTAQYSANQSSQFLNAVYNFAQHGSLDPKAALTPIAATIPSKNITVYRALRFYDSKVDVPGTWENLSMPHMTPLSDDYSLRPLTEYLKADGGTAPGALRRKWRFVSSVVSRDAIEIIHNILIRESYARLSNRVNSTAGVAFQPITQEFLRQGQLKGGNPHGLDSSKGPYFWSVLQLACEDNDEDYEALHEFAEYFFAEVTKKLKAKGLHTEYLYMNDAGEGQKVFESYGRGNLERLKDIREKYDPLKVYSELMPGGWKVYTADRISLSLGLSL